MVSPRKSMPSIGLVIIFGFLPAFFNSACVPPDPEPTVITIMAANITSGDYSAYEAPGIRIFQGLKPDIVLIQEFDYEHGTVGDLVEDAFGLDPEYFYSIESGSEEIPNGIVSKYNIIASGQWIDSVVPDRDFAWARIDIPGDIDLQVVSVHLKGGSSSAGERNAQANAIKGYVEDNFDADHYIAVGGDLNLYSTSESAFNTFRTFLDPDDHIPVCQDGNSYTNEPRNKPYDWIMPNDLLNAAHTVLKIGDDTFYAGLVFDSWVYPSPRPAPILYGDSHCTGMQHMPVMKAFLVNTIP